MRRMVVAAPPTLLGTARRAPLDELARHHCLSLGQQRRSFAIRTCRAKSTIKVAGRFECNDGAVLHDWALAGRGLAWRSLWEVGHDVRAGRLVPVLDDYAALPLGIYAVFPQRRQLPLRVRLFIDLLKHTYGSPDYWDSKGGHPAPARRASRRLR
jgi:DNA-binding transcriptional LysR family regulator